MKSRGYACRLFNRVYNKIMNKSPEQIATQEFNIQREQYEEAKVIGLMVVTERQPVTFGEVVSVIKEKGINEHLASQALDAMTGRKIDITELGRLVTK